MINSTDTLGVYSVLTKALTKGELSKDQFNAHLAYDSINNKSDYEPILYPKATPELVKYVTMRIKRIGTRDTDIALAVGSWSHRVRQAYFYNKKSLELLHDDLKLFINKNMTGEATAIRTLIYKHELNNESFDSQFYRDCDKCLEIEAIERSRV